MTNKTLIVETESGEQFIADIKHTTVEVNMEKYGDGRSSVTEREHHFEVGELINVETGEKY